MQQPPPKPNLINVDHISLTVADLDATLTFYRDVFGAVLKYRMGPFDAREMSRMEDGRDWTESHVNVKDARLEIAMLQLTPNMKMELFQYHRPKECIHTPPRNCDIGSRHLCFQVDDVHNAIAYLEYHGCKAMSGPITIEGGPCPSSHSWYVLDPFGHQIELVEYL